MNRGKWLDDVRGNYHMWWTSASSRDGLPQRFVYIVEHEGSYELAQYAKTLSGEHDMRTWPAERETIAGPFDSLEAAKVTWRLLYGE